MPPCLTRRLFVEAISASSLWLFDTRVMHATSSVPPIGLQLYTVGKEMASDPAGTLKKVKEAGYSEVELSPIAAMSSKDLRALLDDNGLKNPSGHYLLQDLLASLPQKIEAAKELGEEYMIVTVPWVRDVSKFPKKAGQGDMEYFIGILNALTLDDWKWNADQFNRIGAETKKAGLQLGYHNHNFDFKEFGATCGYDEFIRLTDPELVKLELDCGWAVVAGKDPINYLKKFPDRYRFLHVKDFRKGFTPRTTLLDSGPGAPVATELGRGAIDYSRILSAIQNVNIKALFVEQEPPYTEMPALEAIKVDYQYLKKLNA